MNEVSIGFVGCGSHATNNLYPMLRYARCRLQAVCDLQPELAERNARIFGAKAHYTDVDRMLGSERLDAVMVVGPSELHHRVGLKALARGLPVFVEKPPAPDLARTRELIDAARANKTFLMTGFMKRHGMAYAKARAMIRSGEFVPAMGFFRYGHWAMTDLRGMLGGMCIHPIDLALSLMGEPVRVHSQMLRSARATSLAVTLRFASGTIAQLMLDASQPRIQEHVVLSGSMDGGNAMIVVDNVQQMEVHRQGRNGIDLLAPTLPEVAPEFDLEDIHVWRPDYGIPNMGQTRHFFQGFAGEVREFVNAVLERREPDPGHADAINAMRVIEAIAARPDGETDLTTFS
ncbi:MAG: Gfo/Idh/MocA family oxidoreductase [Planctomycetota bacterium]|nr:Gfo/Idh/MocA family oxidoreductase [Planctomycetota bacterium]